MHINHTNYMGRKETYTVEEFVHMRLTELNSEGGELEQLWRQINRNTELLAKLAQLTIKSEDDLKELVYLSSYDDEVVA